MEDEDWEKKGKRHPFLPPNYVTIVQLRERCLQEKERKQREKEQEEEEERQRKLQLQKKLQEEEKERKQKLGRKGLKGGSGIDNETVRRNWKPISLKNRRVVDVSPAKPEESEVAAAVPVTGNMSAEQEQKGEEPKEEKKKRKPKKWKNRKKKKQAETKPAAEEEEQEKKEAETKPAAEEEEQEKKDMTDGTVSAKLVIRARENAPAKRDGGSKRTRRELKPKRENGDGAAEIERSFGHLSMNGEIERVTVRADIHFRGPKAGDNRGNREYRGQRRIRGHREVGKQSGPGMVWVRKGELSEGNIHAVQTFK